MAQDIHSLSTAVKISFSKGNAGSARRLGALNKLPRSVAVRRLILRFHDQLGKTTRRVSARNAKAARASANASRVRLHRDSVDCCTGNCR